MIRDDIREMILAAVRAAQEAHELPAVAIPDVTVERPSKEEHGDYASSIALRMARVARMAPLAIAEVIASHAMLPETVSAVEVAPPGFINIRLASTWLTRQVDAIKAEGRAYGAPNLGEGRRVQVEFVSANPTGPLHVGTGRGA